MQFPEITPLDNTLRPALQAAIDDKTKPLGALGRLESLALQLGLILGTQRPVLQRPTVIVFAADHGVADAGVSAYPAEVTAQMVRNFLAGGAAINVFSRQHGIALEIVDAGVRAPLPAAPGLVNCRIADGTRNFAQEPAMSPEQAAAAMTAGMARVLRHAQQGCNVIGFGEMGIANTSAAACLMQRLTGLPLADCIGRGTGLDDAGLARKREVLEGALTLHADAQAPLDVLATFGGFEIAMMAGAFLAAAASRMVILVDGFIASAALLVAQRIDPSVLQYCVFTHCSHERGHRALLDHFGAEPLLALDLRLGEGTGAALAWPLLASAVAFLNEMATFSGAGVSTASA
ncbi:nicotinate-nucleotide--dimethylbenzimidazole phosphoribosyltransferase [Cupriavidus oxalaticus]|jgi:nicotinate-nucleotide--dimethylbenzimidazole phosphoribosyltransferase|uniref:Nicotinate-nucleotide--dimethylbenzimidazole phosphoribosyltransferase n=1 Tax=Cupriavidus oxalaticus TaxID=96344 RepID=A0A976BD36_9BURK|nr:nicotinate-nucleotide--dimethylbenzimidazole phosphoribosyltransferase [Cupriavidus oxalaticus]QRQ88084.1 nicotinate-nucleotide--dimethylbenzimidazole phosphoribosyltransferase [Cupriavidus oxalaticus]QRQ93590.1 nicotinate-nucleotide--dimethylbenzimidazole phosphoribosyltransferase [Cupriavidus oxalaticus]WQD82218.1 nicotinate-nucleotide--dimethylbenzimidazole phosphoribosyltransferase [Cupriavidus oxalaticus]SPC14356.1 Nicotinate-nucleotide--dimethylbenzimidazole phosphoribosyltransferase [